MKKTKPNNLFTLCKLGETLQLKAKYTQALEYYLQAYQLDASNILLICRINQCYLLNQQYQEALAFITTAINKLNTEPTADLLHERANSYFLNNQLIQAKQDWNCVLTINPKHKIAMWNMVVLNKNLHLIEESIPLLKKLISLEPNNIIFLNELTAQLINLGNYLEAKKIAINILKLENNFYALFNLANCYNALGDTQHASEYFQKALLINNPLHDDIHIHLALIYKKNKLYSKANFHFNQVMPKLIKKLQLGKHDNFMQQLSQTSIEGLGFYGFYCLENCAWHEFSLIQPLLASIVQTQLQNNTSLSITPFNSIIMLDFATYHQAIATAHATAILQKIQHPLGSFAHSFKYHKIHIGYISADFYDHPTALLLGDFFAYHNPEQFEIHCYAVFNVPDAYQASIKNSCDFFTDISQLSFKQAAQKIYTDQIDILVELSQYCANSKPSILAYQPAPVQCHYFGYCGTSGAPFMQYHIMDYNWLPSAREHSSVSNYFTENIVLLPHISYQALKCNSKLPPRQKYNLPLDQIVFSSFNKTYRINQQVFSCWLKILQQVPNSVLWLSPETTLAKHNLLEYAKINGNLHQRIIFTEPQRLTLNWHHALSDIALDTFIFSSGTYSYLCCLANVPVVTLQGQYPHNKITSSILKSLQLSELIAHSQEQYIAISVKLATDSIYRQQVKNKIKQQLKTSPLLDHQQNINNLEQAFLKMRDNYNNATTEKIMLI